MKRGNQNSPSNSFCSGYINKLEIMIICGIYKIESKFNSKRIYIGSSYNIYSRWAVHLTHLKQNKHHSKKLQRHYNKYGKSDLLFSIVTSCELSELIEKEQYFIDVYKPYFNNRTIAEANYGIKMSEEHKLKLHNINIGRIKSIEERKKLSLANKGVKRGPHTLERILNMSKPRSEQAKQNIREGRLRNKKPSPLIGRKRGTMSVEQKLKISLSNKGKHSNKIISQETRLKRSLAMKGHKHSEETKHKISIGNIGNKGRKGISLTQEHKNKIGLGVKTYYYIKKGIHNGKEGFVIKQ